MNLQKKIKSLNDTAAEKNEIIEKAKKELNDTTAEKNEIIEKTEEEMKELNDTIIERNEAIEKAKKEMIGLTNTISEKNEYIDRYCSEIKALKSQCEDHTKKNSTAKSDMDKLTKQYNFVCLKIASLSEKYKDAKKVIIILKTEVYAKLETYKKMLSSNIPKMKQQIKEIQAEVIARFIKSFEASKKTLLAKQQELESVVKLKDEELVKMQEEAQQKLLESEEFQQIIAELEQRRAEVQDKDNQLEEMYNKVVALEEKKVTAESAEGDGNGEGEVLKKKLEEMEVEHDELLVKYQKCQSEYIFLTLFLLNIRHRHNELQTQYVELTQKYIEATTK